MVVDYVDKIPSRNEALRIVEKVKQSETTPFVIEKTKDGRYMLIKGFREYAAFMEVQPEYRIKCSVVPALTEKHRLLRIIRYTLTNHQITWLFKYKHLSKLIHKHYMTPDKIAHETKLPLELIKEHLFDTRIPIHIQNQASILGVREILDEIRFSSSIPPEMKPILYKRSILPNEHMNRIDRQKLFYLQQFCSSCYIPDYLLYNLELLEQFIDELLSTNFQLSTHWNKLLIKFIKVNRLKSCHSLNIYLLTV